MIIFNMHKKVWRVIGVGVALCVFSQMSYSMPICAIDAPFTLWVQRSDESQLGDSSNQARNNDFLESGQIGQLYRATEPAEFIELLLEDLVAIYRYGIEIESDTGERSLIEQIGRLYRATDPAKIIQLLLADLSAAYREELARQSGNAVIERSVDVDERQLATVSAKGGATFVDALAAVSVGGGGSGTTGESAADARVLALQTEAQKSGFHFLVAISALRGEQRVVKQNAGTTDEEVEVVSYNLSIDLKTTAVNSWRNQKARTTYRIKIALTDQSSAADLRAAIRDGARTQLERLRNRSILPQKYSILSSEGRLISLDNNGEKIPLGYEFSPLLPSAEACTRVLAHTVLRTVKSDQGVSLLRNISLTAEQMPAELITDPKKVAFEIHLGYVFPLTFSDAHIIVPSVMVVGGIRILPVIPFGFVRPFFQLEVQTIIDQFIIHIPAAAMIGVEFAFHAGPVILKPSIAGGVLVGGGVSRIASPFLFAAAGGTVKLSTGVNITRTFSLFLDTGFTQWFTFYDTAHPLVKKISYLLSVGYGGVEVSLNMSLKL